MPPARRARAVAGRSGRERGARANARGSPRREGRPFPGSVLSAQPARAARGDPRGAPRRGGKEASVNGTQSAWSRTLLAAALGAALAVAGTACSSGGTSGGGTAPATTAPATTAPATTAPATTAPAAGLSGTWSGRYSGAFSGEFRLRWTQRGSALS